MNNNSATYCTAILGIIVPLSNEGVIQEDMSSESEGAFVPESSDDDANGQTNDDEKENKVNILLYL